MKRVALTSLLLVASAGCAVYAREPRHSLASFDAFLRTWEKGQELFINGDPTAWKRNVSRGDDATIFGAFGGHEKGVEVGPRYDWAASQYENSGATKSINYLNKSVSGDLAVTVSIERDRARTKGQHEPIDRALRVTQVFRWEGGGWKLLHRHADPMLDRRAPSRG